MEYLASEIIERAKNLADIGNTDYISHKEAIQYLNDAYNWVYQLSINRGDNFFVKEIGLGVGDNPLPKDFYQLKSIKNPFSGYLYTRKPLNAGKNEPGYEIINNKVNISGINSNCIMSYFPIPKLLTFPNTTKQIEDFPIPNSLYSLYKDNMIYIEGEELFRFNIPNGTTNHIDYDIEEIAALYTSNNYFVAIKPTSIDYIDFDGNKIKTIKYEENTKNIIFRKQNGEIDVVNNNTINYRGQTTETLTTNYIQGSAESLYYINNGILYKQDFNDKPIEINEANSFFYTRKYGKEYLVFENENQLFVYIDEDIWPLDIDYNQLIGYTDYYIIVNDGVFTNAYSNEPDILLNYPDNTYYGLLAYQLALYFVIKQGGNPGLLGQQLEKAQFDFENNVQDSFTSVRIKNVYK